jgi:hypothetical protein
MANFKNTLVCTALMHDTLPQGAKWMLESAQYHGIEMTVIGEQMKWENYWLSKCVRLYERIAGWKNYDYVVFVDGDDTLWATGLGELHAKFASYNTSFVMAGEHYCWPYWRYSDSVPNAPHRFRNPCSGFWMATWPGFLATFERLLNCPHTNECEFGHTIYNSDQARYLYGWITGQLQFTVDYRCLLSQCLNGVDDRWTPANPDLEWGKRPRNRLTGTYPCTFHANGDHKWRLGGISELLLS